MAITQAVCTSFKQELLQGIHNLTNGAGGGTTTTTGTGNTFKLALYTSSATLDASTTAFTVSNEVSGTGYSSGGGTLTNVTPSTSGTTALTDFADLTFSAATITARGAMIYNSSTTAGTADRAVLILGTSSGATSTEDWTFQVLRNPDESGTIISNAVSSGVSNSNHGSANTPNATTYRGVEGDTITGGTGARLPIQQQSNRTVFPLGRRLPKGSSIAFRITPPASNVNVKATLVTHFYYGFNI